MPKTFINEDSTIIDKYIYSQFIPYVNLRQIIDPVLSTLDKPIINVYIDLYSMLMPLYGFYNYTNPLSLTACMVNAAIHYRNFLSKYNVYSNIFLIYSPTMSSSNLRFCPDYNSANIEKMLHNSEVRNLIDQNLTLLGTLIPYLPDIYFRIGTVEVSVIMADMMTGFESRGYHTNHLVISSSPIAFQIPSLVPNAYVFCKRRNGDLLVVTKDNVLSQALAYTKNQFVDLSYLNQSWLSGFYTLTGLEKRNIKALASYKTTIRILEKMQFDHELMNPDALVNAYMTNYSGKKKDINTLASQIHNRFKCFDLIQQLLIYNLLPESKEISYLTQLQNLQELLHLNELYFRDNPMQLDKL